MKTLAALFFAFAAAGAGAEPVLLAIGAHAGDMEVSAGAVLARHAKSGDRVVLLHLTLGEAGHPKLAPKLYGEQKRREAEAAARALGAEALFGPWRDAELPDDDAARRWVADMIRKVRPNRIVTHPSGSIHKDHSTAHRIVLDAVLLAALESVVTQHPRHRGVSVYFAENWEDADGFRPYIYVDVSDCWGEARKAAEQYEFTHGVFSGFRYLDYYDGLSKVRGAEIGKDRAVAFDVAPMSKRRSATRLP